MKLMLHSWTELLRGVVAQPVAAVIVLVVVLLLLAAPPVIRWLASSGRIDGAQREELSRRYRSWLVIVPLIGVPVLSGRVFTILAVGVLSLLCYAEFSRATGLFRERAISLVVVLGMVLVTSASLDAWFRFFLALFPLVTCAIAIVGIFPDRPRGYIQRVALGVLGFALFGCALGHLGYFANDNKYRSILLALLLCVEINDVFAYIVGKCFGGRCLGGRKLAPNTSPGKTLVGAIGSLALTAPLVVLLMHLIYHGTALDRPMHLVDLALIVGLLGPLGDLMLSSIKRDLGLKDMGAVFPGHGGLLDRFDSLILVAPAVFHYINAFAGVGPGS